MYSENFYKDIMKQTHRKHLWSSTTTERVSTTSKYLTHFLIFIMQSKDLKVTSKLVYERKVAS